MKRRTSDVSESAFRAFVRTSGLFRNRMDPYFARFGISGAQWGVLRTLQRAEAEGLQGLRLTDLGQRLLVRPPSVTTVVDRLNRTGLVTRRVTADDQRAKQVALTPAGRELVARVLQHHPAQIRAILSCLSTAEQRQLRQLMQRLAAHLESPPPLNSLS
jgi:DNA-binding MarR family transcriptional regulator